MKKYTEIEKEIESITTENERLTNEIIAREEERKEKRREARKNGVTYAQINQMYVDDYKKENEICKKINMNKIIVKILENNKKIAMVSELAPVICEEFNRYKGKRYGERTKEKIRNAIQEKSGFSVWHHKSYFEKIIIYGKNYSSYECGHKNGQIITDENIINEISPENIKPLYIINEYVENPEERAAELQKLFSEVIQKQEELKAVISDFNKICVGIEGLYDHNNFKISI